MKLERPEKLQTPKKVVQPIRKPVQSRSINTKGKILEAAVEVFCEKGYHKTTTNEIAQRAQVSIGSLYSYYKDKDTIFFEILERYQAKFDTAKNEVMNDPELLKADPKAWLRILIENLIKVHEEAKELNRELTVLSYYNQKVADIQDQYKEKNMRETIGYFMQLQNDFIAEDLEATAIVTYDMISSTVDRIVFGKNEIDRERLINAAIDVVYKYFIK